MDGSYDIGNSDGAPNIEGITLEYSKKDIELLRDMWDDIFADPDEFAEYYFREICSKNNILVAYDGDLPVGMVHLNTYEVTVYGKKTECIYIVGVCVKPDYRRKGIMRMMLQKIKQDVECKDNGFLFLMPEAREYYTGLGFESIYDTCVAECNILYEDMVEERCFKDFETLGLGIINMSEYDDEALAILSDKINDYLQKEYEVYSVRSPKYLKTMLMEHICQNGNVCVVKWGSTDILGLFSYDIYDGILYAERVEIFDGNVNDMLTCIVRKCLENACVGCVVTLPQKFVEATDINIPGMDIQLKEGHGIMAYVKKGKSELLIEQLRGKTFFDEIV